jgi:hypothetical protein
MDQWDQEEPFTSPPYQILSHLKGPTISHRAISCCPAIQALKEKKGKENKIKEKTRRPRFLRINHLEFKAHSPQSYPSATWFRHQRTNTDSARSRHLVHSGTPCRWHDFSVTMVAKPINGPHWPVAIFLIFRPSCEARILLMPRQDACFTRRYSGGL